MRWILLAVCLSGCGAKLPPVQERKPVFVESGYVLRSFSVDVAPRSIGATWTFDSTILPSSGVQCVGVSVCNDTTE
jgi:hypothetical protein